MYCHRQGYLTPPRSKEDFSFLNKKNDIPPLLLLIITLLCTTYASAQSVPMGNVSKSLPNWAQHLNADVDKYFTPVNSGHKSEKWGNMRQNLQPAKKETSLSVIWMLLNRNLPFMRRQRKTSPIVSPTKHCSREQGPEKLELLMS